jgi:hypothetical protein
MVGKQDQATLFQRQGVGALPSMIAPLDSCDYQTENSALTFPEYWSNGVMVSG